MVKVWFGYRGICIYLEIMFIIDIFEMRNK